MTKFIPPLVTAEADAWDEVCSLRREAQLALVLQDSRVGYQQAVDACEAYTRAVARWEQVRHLADHEAGQYNAWDQ